MRNNIKCKLCQKFTFITNNKCEMCQATIIQNDYMGKQLKSAQNYNYFIKEIIERSGLEEYIVKKIIELNLIDQFFYKQVEFCAGKTCVTLQMNSVAVSYENNLPVFFIDKYIKINQKSIPFIFFKYKEYDTDYNLFEAKREVLSNALNRPILSSTSNKEILISIFSGMSNNSSLNLLIDYSEEMILPYDLELLNDNEQLEFYKDLKEQTQNECLNFSFINNKRYLSLKLEINELYSLDRIMNEIRFQINDLYKKNKVHRDLLKEKNKKYFERVLLEKELISF